MAARFDIDEIDRRVRPAPREFHRFVRANDWVVSEVRAGERVLPVWAWMLLVAVAGYFAGQWVLR
jgi:hypothetical protein